MRYWAGGKAALPELEPGSLPTAHGLLFECRLPPKRKFRFRPKADLRRVKKRPSDAVGIKDDEGHEQRDGDSINAAPHKAISAAVESESSGQPFIRVCGIRIKGRGSCSAMSCPLPLPCAHSGDWSCFKGGVSGHKGFEPLTLRC